jgi:hypothetical protein
VHFLRQPSEHPATGLTIGDLGETLRYETAMQVMERPTWITFDHNCMPAARLKRPPSRGTCSASEGLNHHFIHKFGVSAMRKLTERSGKVGYILMWLLGIPIPILLIIFLLRGCN